MNLHPTLDPEAHATAPAKPRPRAAPGAFDTTEPRRWTWAAWVKPSPQNVYGTIFHRYLEYHRHQRQ